MVEVSIHGNGQSVVVLHGPPLPPESVASVVDRLSGRFQVVVPNYRGLRIGPVETRRRLVDALHAHGIHEAAFVTHSYASTHAFQIALDATIQVSQIAALGAVGHLGDDTLAAYEELATAVEAGTVDATRLLLSMWFSPEYLAGHTSVEPMFRTWFDEFGKEGLAASARIDFRAPDLRPRLPILNLPVYLRVGSDDRAAPVEWSNELASLLPNATLDVVAGLGHFTHIEDPDGTVSALEAFLSVVKR